MRGTDREGRAKARVMGTGPRASRGYGELDATHIVPREEPSK